MGTGDVIQILKYDPCFQINKLYLFLISLLKCICHFIHSCSLIHEFIHMQVWLTYPQRYTRIYMPQRGYSRQILSVTETTRAWPAILKYISCSGIPVLWTAPLNWLSDSEITPFFLMTALVWSISPNSQTGKYVLQCDFPLFQLVPA